MCRKPLQLSSRLALGLVMFFVLSSGLWSQEQPSTSLPLNPAIGKLQQVTQQLQTLKLQIQDYQLTWQVLSPAWQSLLKIETQDNESLTQLTSQLSNSAQDSQAVSQLSTKLSQQFNQLSISFETAKLINRITVPLGIVVCLALGASVATKGFTQF